MLPPAWLRSALTWAFAFPFAFRVPFRVPQVATGTTRVGGSPATISALPSLGADRRLTVPPDGPLRPGNDTRSQAATTRCDIPTLHVRNSPRSLASANPRMVGECLSWGGCRSTWSPGSTVRTLHRRVPQGPSAWAAQLSASQAPARCRSGANRAHGRSSRHRADWGWSAAACRRRRSPHPGPVAR